MVKNMAKRGKMAIKKWFLGVKSGYLGLENDEPAPNLERQNGAKCK